MSGGLHVERFELGAWMTNCYVIHRGPAERGRACWIVDAGYEPGPLIGYVRHGGLEPRAVLLTHAHLDHIGGLEAVRRAWPELPILIHPAERALLGDPLLNLSAFLGVELVAPEATGTLEAGQVIDVDGLALEVRHTPGHSPGGVSLYQRESELVLAGDTLFAGSVGRTDFPTSNHATLMSSIRTQLLTLPDTTRVYPGHGPDTTVAAERRGNPFLR